MDKKCENCGKELFGVHGLTWFCPECAEATKQSRNTNSQRRRRALERLKHPRLCATCGIPVTGKKLYCEKCKKERDRHFKSRDYALKKECTAKAKATEKSFNEILREAKKMNMTYGEYISYCQQKGS